MNLVDDWEEGCWCLAVIRLCEMHIVEGDLEDTRYPEQWMYVAWRPGAKGGPQVMPDGWGLTVGDPWHTLLGFVGTDPVYELVEEECLWSAWLSIPLVCDRYEPWLINAITSAKEVASQREQSIYAMRYGNHAKDTQRFLNLITEPASDQGSVDQLVKELLTQVAKSSGPHQGPIGNGGSAS